MTWKVFMTRSRVRYWGASAGGGISTRLNDAMAGEFGGLPREFRLEWVNSRLSEVRLVQAGTGGFADLVQIIRGHPNVELVLL